MRRANNKPKRRINGRSPTGITVFRDTVMTQFNVAPAGVTATVLTLNQLFPGLSNQSANNRVVTWTKSVVEVLPTLGNGRISMQAQVTEDYLPGSQFGFGSTSYKLLSHVNSTYMTLNLATMARTASNMLRPYLITGLEALQITSRCWDDETEANSVLMRITSTCRVFPQGNLISQIASVRSMPDTNLYSVEDDQNEISCNCQLSSLTSKVIPAQDVKLEPVSIDG